jgi:hypothetical protein
MLSMHPSQQRKNHSKQRNVSSVLPDVVVSSLVLVVLELEIELVLVKIHQKTSMLKVIWIEPNNECQYYLVC